MTARPLLPPPAYTDVSRVGGPLMVVQRVHGAGWDDDVTLVLGNGEERHGVVLDADGDTAVVEVLEGTSGVDRSDVAVTFAGHPFAIPVGEAWLGRACNGRGAPIDDGPPVLTGVEKAVAGTPINPVCRDIPREPVITGVSAIDGLMTLVLGQKLPLFSEGGLGHLRLATQIAAQARIPHGRLEVVFVALGITHADIDLVREVLEDRSGAGELVLVANSADDPAMERILAPRVGLTIAEHLAFERGGHVLTILCDMTAYAEAVREVSAARREIPGRRGYPGYLFSDLASVYERCGRIRGLPGSLTQMPVLTMPSGDISHPVPDLTGYITEGQIVLSRDAAGRGVDPPVDPLSSLSRLMRHGAGAGLTRRDHADVAAQVYAALSHAAQVRELADLVGVAGITDTDRSYLAFADAVDRDVFTQRGDEFRTMDDTLRRCWRALGVLPRRELTLVRAADIDEFLGAGDHDPPAEAGAAGADGAV